MSDKPSSPCPLDDSSLDVVPECYHYSNRCICFMCTCGRHLCPSAKKSFYSKDSFKSSYKRCFSRPSISPTPQRVQNYYHRNMQKMDLETEYQRRYSGFTIECTAVSRAVTPQPQFKFEGNSQYKRDFPNWGPVDYVRMNRPVQPVHETKLKFEGKSSYECFYRPVKGGEGLKKNKSSVGKKERFVVPLQSSSQRDYKKISSDYFPQYEHRKQDEYQPTNYNPHQFKTTSHAAYVNTAQHVKDPMKLRKMALFAAK
jgi:hypothetical protein